MAMFMTANNLTKEDVLERGDKLAFPDSVKNLMRGDLGQIKGGFPKKIQKLVLKDEKPFTDKPNKHLKPINFKKEFAAFKKEFDNEHLEMRDFLSYKLYPKVFTDFYDHFQKYGVVRVLPSTAFFYGLKSYEEIIVKLEAGKNLLIQYLDDTQPNEQGNRMVFFNLNGQTRAVMVKDNNSTTTVVENRKASGSNEVGSPLQGSLSKVLVKEGQEVKENTPLFIIEAMKMESTITAPQAGVVKKIHLKDKTLVEQDDLVVELE